jgi:hypothetical protein
LLLFTTVIMKHQHEYKDWFLPHRVFPPRREKTRRWETSFRSLFTGQPSYLPEISDPQNTWQLPSRDAKQTTSAPSPQSGRLWAKSRQTALRTKAPSEHSFQKEVRTSAEEREPWGLAESSRQAEATSTGPEVIDATRGKDSIDKTTRTVNDTVQEADDRRYASVLQPSIRSNHPHCIWPQSEEPRRSAAAERERRPQASEERRPSIPSQALKFTIPHFFLPFAGDAETGGACWTNFELKHYTGSTGDQRAIDVSRFHKNQGTPLLQSCAGNELPRNTSATLTR